MKRLNCDRYDRTNRCLKVFGKQVLFFVAIFSVFFLGNKVAEAWNSVPVIAENKPGNPTVSSGKTSSSWKTHSSSGEKTISFANNISSLTSNSSSSGEKNNASESKVCNTREELVSAIIKKAEKKPSSISFTFSSLLLPYIEDADWMTEVLYDSGIHKATWVRSSSGGKNTCTINEITYMDAETCDTEAQFLNLLKKAKTTSTISIRPSSTLYEKLKTEDWALLYELEGQAGIVDGTFSYYNEPYRVIEFTELQFEENFYQVTSMDQVKRHMDESVQKGKTTIAFYCSDSLYTQLYGGMGASGTNYSQDVAENYGIASSNFQYSSAKKLIFSTNLEYFPGAKISLYAKNNQLGKLSSTERALYDRAMLIVNRCKAISSNDYELVINICEEIAAGSHYQLCEDEACEGCERDNAYGVLMLGGGECDSYTDAFYLVASLAGLDVGYQHGDSSSAFDSMTSDSTHIWNTVTLDGSTYFLDMTWADPDSDSHVLDYYWIMFGQDIAQHTHIWDTKTLRNPIAATTSKKIFYYYRENCSFTSLTEAQNYIRRNKDNGKNCLSLMLVNNSSSSNESLLQEMMDGLRLGGYYVYRYIGKYIFISYYFN